MTPLFKPWTGTVRLSNSYNSNTLLARLSESLAVNVPWGSLLQRLPGLLILCLVPFSLFGPLVTPLAFSLYLVFLHGLFVANNLRSAWGVYSAYTNAVKNSTTNWLQKYTKDTGTSNGSDLRHDLPFDSISHMIILPNYKESMETLQETLDVLASHQRALTQYRVCFSLN
jgi:hypothetical protein